MTKGTATSVLNGPWSRFDVAARGAKYKNGGANLNAFYFGRIRGENPRMPQVLGEAEQRSVLLQ